MRMIHAEPMNNRRLANGALAMAAAALAFAAPQPAHAERIFDADAGVVHDSNLTRAQNAADIRPDAAATLAASLGEFYAPTGNDGLTFAAFARGASYRRYHGLNDLVLGVRAHARHKFGMGSEAPWLALSVAASHDDYRDTLRDSNRIEVRAEAGRRFTRAVDGAAGIVFDRRYDNHGESLVPGIPGDVFNLRGFGGYARAGYAITDALYLGANVAVRRGDVESTAQQSLPIFLASSAIAEDPVFGSDDLDAYRLRGTTWTGGVTASLALDDRSSLNLEYSDERTYAAYGNQYRSRIVRFVYAFRP
jgi:hypothetical protein